MSDMTAGDDEPVEIAVGAVDGALRFCLAVEAARQGELRLAGQQANLQAVEARATSLLGWAVAGLTGMAVLALDRQHRILVIPPAACLAACAAFCIAALGPKAWHMAGYTASDLADWRVGTELELRESLAVGYEGAAAGNKRVMDRIAWFITAAWACLIAAPVTGSP